MEVLGVKGSLRKNQLQVHYLGGQQLALRAAKGRPLVGLWKNKRGFVCHDPPANSTFQSITPEMAADSPSCWIYLSKVGHSVTDVINTSTILRAKVESGVATHSKCIISVRRRERGPPL